MKALAIAETALFVDDLSRSAAFYRDVLELKQIADWDRLAVFEAGQSQVLLLFTKGGSLEPISTPGGMVPPGEADGIMHVAFAVSEDELPDWERRLTENGVEIESRVNWMKVPWPGPVKRQSGQSVYFRDPDNHVLEFATPGVWPGSY